MLYRVHPAMTGIRTHNFNIWRIISQLQCYQQEKKTGSVVLKIPWSLCPTSAILKVIQISNLRLNIKPLKVNELPFYSAMTTAIHELKILCSSRFCSVPVQSSIYIWSIIKGLIMSFKTIEELSFLIHEVFSTKITICTD